MHKPRTNTFSSSLHTAEKYDAGKQSTELQIKSCCTQVMPWAQWLPNSSLHEAVPQSRQGSACFDIFHLSAGCFYAGSQGVPWLLTFCLCSLPSALSQNSCSDAAAGLNLTWKYCNCSPVFLTLFFHAVSC